VYYRMMFLFFFLNTHDLPSPVRHIEMSYVFDWSSHIDNCPDAREARTMRLNHVHTWCAIMIHHANGV